MVSSAGATGVLLFLLAYAVLTVAPIPRTVFNLAAGLLLGDVVGIGVALIATVISGALGFALARLLGGGLLDRALHRDSARAVHQRLAHAGTLSVSSLRLIPFIPFAPLSYCCGISSVRLRPYLLGTVPGTVAVVVLGDALTGGTPPAVLVCYAVFAAAGAWGRAQRSAERSRNPWPRREYTGG